MVKKERKLGATAKVVSDRPSVIVDECDERIAVLRRGVPPLAVSFEEFRDRFHLNANGMNLYKRVETVDIILQTDLRAVFGSQRGK